MDKVIQENFNRVFAKQGNFFDLEPFLERIRDNPEEAAFYKFILEDCQRLVQLHLKRYVAPPIVHVAFLQNHTLGAVVVNDSVSNACYIGLYFGSVLVLRSIFSRMLCSPNVLPWLGNNAYEEAQRVQNPFLIDMDLLNEALNIYDEQRVEPYDSYRRQSAKVMTRHAMHFLTLHELGHIVRGHLGYNGLRSEKVLPVISQDAQSGLESQAMEADADHFAAFHGVMNCHKLYNEKITEIEDRIKTIDIWFFSVYTTFRLLGMIPFNPKKLEYYSHPPAGMRLSMLGTGLSAELNRKSMDLFGRQLTREENVGIVFRCMHDVELAFLECADNKEIIQLGGDPIQFAFQEIEHIEKIMDTLDKIWDNISQFKLAFINP